MSNVLLIMPFVIPGIVTILAPLSHAFFLAFVWLKDLVVIRSSTSYFSISFAISLGGSVPLTFGIGILINFTLGVILFAASKNSFAIEYNLESVTINNFSFFFRFRHFLRTMLTDLIILA